jgi:branched-chain amino acid aminotransferase
MIYLNNRIVTDAMAKISVFDHGFLYGDGVFETLRAYRGTVFLLEEHIERLFRSAGLIGLNINRSAKSIKKAVYDTLRANRLKEAVIRITISRGAGPPGLDPGLCRRGTFIIFARKCRPYPKSFYSRGTKIIIPDTRRNHIRAVNPAIKSLNFLNNIQAKREALKANAFEAIMLDYRGFLSEGTVSNIFFVKNDTLFTPSRDTGILQGITRQTILSIVRESGIRVQEGRYKPARLYSADEIFLASTTMEVLPVAAAGTRQIRNSPGPMTGALHSAYMQKVKDYPKEM